MNTENQSRTMMYKALSRVWITTIHDAKYVLFHQFYWWENGGQEVLSNLAFAIGKIQTQALFDI